MALRQAESGVRGQSEEGAKIVVDEVHESTWAVEEFELQIRGFKRSRLKAEGDLLLTLDGHMHIEIHG